MRYFGPLRPGDKVFEGKWKVKLKCYGNNCYYSRTDDEGNKVERILGSYSNIVMRPTIYGGELAYYLYLHFKRPITLIPYSSINFTIGIPIDVEVVLKLDELGKNFVIDLIELSEVFYALYGKPERGILCRYHKTKLGSWNWISEAQLNVVITNRTEKVVTVNRLVFPTLLPEVYYEPRSHRAWVSPLDVLIEGNTASISRDPSASPPEGYLKNPSSGKLPRWTMIFGL